MTTIIIREARVDDLDALKALPYSAGLPAKHFDRLARQQAGSVRYLLACDGPVIVGYMLVKWDGPEAAGLRQLVGPCAEIEDFVVAPERRGEGIGTALLAAAERLARERGMDRLGLAVGLENTAAWSLYDTVGFLTVPGSDHRATWEAPGPDGETIVECEDCHYMVKDLR